MLSKSASDRALWITYINITLYALCYQLQRPIEPFLVDALSKDGDDVSLIYGKIQAFFSFMQTIGSPLVGIMLDRIGVRYASAVVFLASALSYAILASATDLNLLMLSKVPTALQAAFLVAQAIAASSTGGDPASRAAALGRMTTAYTVGATIGPALGGFLARNGNFYISARYAVFGSIVSVVLSLLFLPSEAGDSTNAATETAATSSTSSSLADASNTEPSEKDTPQATAPTSSNKTFMQAVQHSAELATRANLWPLLVVKVVGGVTASMHSTVLPLVLKQKLKFDPADLGFVMSSSMFAVAGFGAFGMAPMTKWLGSKGMSLSGLGGRAIVGILFALLITASSSGENSFLLYELVGISVAHALLSHLLATGLTTQTTGAVGNDEQGALLGLEHGLFSLARIGGPPVGTALLGHIGRPFLVEGVCGALDVSLILLLVATAAQTGINAKKKVTGKTN
mmetsp:Transcript_4899/g.14173  ORF Transcript_4899/g.14173 Transcript_4899/m.14173 type:complete len:457 (-) Transcript_4899:2025-3395(-)